MTEWIIPTYVRGKWRLWHSELKRYVTVEDKPLEFDFYSEAYDLCHEIASFS